MFLELGKVVSVKDGVVRASGLNNVSAGEMVKIGEVFGMALNLETAIVSIVVFGNDTTIKEGDQVERSKMGVTVWGRVLTTLGKSGPIHTTTSLRVERKAPGIITRKSVYELLQTGIKAIGSLLQTGRGQRELIIGDRQTGKTTAKTRDTFFSFFTRILYKNKIRKGYSGINKRIHLPYFSINPHLSNISLVNKQGNRIAHNTHNTHNTHIQKRYMMNYARMVEHSARRSMTNQFVRYSSTNKDSYRVVSLKKDAVDGSGQKLPKHEHTHKALALGDKIVGFFTTHPPKNSNNVLLDENQLLNGKTPKPHSTGQSVTLLDKPKKIVNNGENGEGESILTEHAEDQPYLDARVSLLESNRPINADVSVKEIRRHREDSCFYEENGKRIEKDE